MFKLVEKNKKIIILIIVILSGFAVFNLMHYLTKLISFINYYGFENVLRQYGNKALFIYFGISFLQPIALPFPEPLTIMAGSKVLGAFDGAVFGFLGTVLGIITMYFFTRITGTKFIQSFVSKDQIEKFNKYIKKNEFIVILLLFILPVLPDEAICIGAGLTKINACKFISIAIISKLLTAFSLSYSVNIIKVNMIHVTIVVIVIFAIKKLIDMRKVKAI